MAKEKSFGELIIEGLQEAVAFERGELKDVKVRRVDLTSRNVQVTPPPRYGASRIAEIRRKLNVSQPVFASMLNVKPATVKAWEQGVREPEGPTRRLLEVAELNPNVITRFEVKTSAPRQRNPQASVRTMKAIRVKQIANGSRSAKAKAPARKRRVVGEE